MPPSPAPVFLAFAFAYLISAALRSINAVIAPELVRDFGLSAGQLGLLSSLYFAGFVLTQWPLGGWLDRHGPRRVELALLALCLLGVALFARAAGLAELALARLLIGVGLSACLMAPYTGFRLWFEPALQARLSTWLLMTGSLGMLLSSLPVQLLLPALGWRGVFVLALALLLLAMGLLARGVPAQAPRAAADGGSAAAGYGTIFRAPPMVALAPFFAVVYAGFIAVQTLWIGPWFTDVAGLSAHAAAWGVLAVHATMGLSFAAWSVLLPRLVRRGIGTVALLKTITPAALLLWALVIALGPRLAGGWSALGWALAFAAVSGASMSQVTIAQAFPAPLAGRVNTASNLLVFGGAFAWQWLLGVAADAFAAGWGLSPAARLQAALALLWLAMLAAYGWLLLCTARAARAAPLA
jgi:MFS family permease